MDDSFPWILDTQKGHQTSLESPALEPPFCWGFPIMFDYWLDFPFINPFYSLSILRRFSHLWVKLYMPFIYGPIMGNSWKSLVVDRIKSPNHNHRQPHGNRVRRSRDDLPTLGTIDTELIGTPKTAPARLGQSWVMSPGMCSITRVYFVYVRICIYIYILYYIISYYIILYHIISYCIILYHIISYHIILYYITVYYISFELYLWRSIFLIC